MTDNSKKTILIVEDELSYGHILSDKLILEGFSVYSAKNGKEGLELAFDKHPNLILLDLQMPKMDGIEMAKRLRAEEWGKTAKVIVLTNHSDVALTQEVIDNDIFVCLVKSDTTLESLVEKVKEMVA